MSTITYTPQSDIVYVRQHNSSHNMGAGDDIVFIKTGGAHEVDGSAGKDLAVLDGKVTDYYIVRTNPDTYRLWGGDLTVTFKNTENLLLRTNADASHIFELRNIDADDTSLVSMRNDFPIVASRNGQKIYAVNDDAEVTAGVGNDHLHAIGQNARVNLAGSINQYVISKRHDGSYHLESEIGGTDKIQGFSWFSFDGELPISVDLLPLVPEAFIEF